MFLFFCFKISQKCAENNNVTKCKDEFLDVKNQ